MARDSHGPIRLGCAVFHRLVGPSVGHGHLCLALAERVNAGVERTLEDAQDLAVRRRPPQPRGLVAGPASALLPVELDCVLSHPEQDLVSAAKLVELLKDEPNQALHALIRVQFDLTAERPDVADWHLHAKLPALGLGGLGVGQTTVQERQLKLAHRALEAQQQAVIGPPRIVHAVAVNDTRVDDAAQVDKSMPVAAISRKSRCLQGKHRADGPGANKRDQVLEARPLREAAAGTAKVAVYHVDFVKAVAAREIR